jgi:hypothetical protein
MISIDQICSVALCSVMHLLKYIGDSPHAIDGLTTLVGDYSLISHW